MPLATASLRINNSWSLTKTNSGFAASGQGPDSQHYSFPVPAGANQLYAADITLAASATDDVNFNSFTNLIGESVTAIGIYSLLVMPVGANVKLTASPSNGLSWFLSGTTPGLTVPDGGANQFVQPTAQAVSGGAGSMRLTNLSGSGPVTVTVVAICGQ